MAENPWVVAPPAAADEPPPPAPAEPAGPLPLTPAAPQPGVPEPDAVDRLPRRPVTARPAVWVVGVHGGSGESSLAALDETWRAAGHAWPLPTGAQPPRGQRVVLVARTSAYGLRRAQLAATEWAAGLVPGVELLGLVLMADAPGRLPRPLRDFAALVSGGVPRTWQVPWVESWRRGGTPTAETTPKELRAVVDAIGALLPSPTTRRHLD